MEEKPDGITNEQAYESSPVTRWLKTRNRLVFTLVVSVVAFAFYTCAFALRKTFTAATFSDLRFGGLNFKVILVITQLLGYGLAKFAGIKIISELKPALRRNGILAVVTIAWMSWLLFALVPTPYNALALLINGFVLGLVWGIVFSYLEGRTVTEVMGAMLSVSFIFSSGLCRTVGSLLLHAWNVSEMWMPFVASCIFLPPLILFLFLLDQTPPPDSEDIKLRTKRMPMNAATRTQFVYHFLPGIVLFVFAYMLLTSFRDLRDNFSAEVWASLGKGRTPAIYSQTEMPVSLGVLIIAGSVFLVKNNKKAFIINHLIIIGGMALLGIGTLLFEFGLITDVAWMILMGLGLYMGYVTFNSIFFDRMLAAFRFVGTVGFIIYVADAFGYVGSIAVMLFSQLESLQISWLEFFITASYFVSVTGFALMSLSMLYFERKLRQMI